MSHNRLQTGGWARQQNSKHHHYHMFSCTNAFRSGRSSHCNWYYVFYILWIYSDRRLAEMAGVNMRLEAGAVRYAVHILYHLLMLMNL